MKRVIILDTETTGVTESDWIVEIAVILYDLLAATPIITYSTLIKCTTNAAAHVNGISEELLRSVPDDTSVIKSMLKYLVQEADAIIAHQAEFDKGFVLRDFNDLGFNDLGFEKLPWICSMRHIDWPNHSKSKSLVNMALSHGVPIISAHRALTDCDILARMLTRTHELGCSLPDLMKTALEPRILVQAMVSYNNRQMAKDADFEWDHNPKFPKKWLKEVREAEIPSIPFAVARMDNNIVYNGELLNKYN
jgi:DNA polymerase-3 subunit epsilon